MQRIRYIGYNLLETFRLYIRYSCVFCDIDEIDTRIYFGGKRKLIFE